MPWFPVDDGFHSHPKVLATSLAARGLWATAGSWCSDTAHLTDGVIPDHVLASLGGTPELAAELVTAGLWRRTRKGFAFHDWFDWGTKRTAEQQRELSAVRAVNGRKGGLASGSKRAANAKQARSKPRGRHAVENSPAGHSPPPDQGRGPSKPEANPKQVASQLVHGGLNPNTSTKELPPNPPQAGGDAAHHGQHPNCRSCGTNPRGPAPEPAPTPIPPPVSEVLAVNGRPARGQTVHDIAAQVRQAITKGTTQ